MQVRNYTSLQSRRSTGPITCHQACYQVVIQDVPVGIVGEEECLMNILVLVNSLYKMFDLLPRCDLQ
jgi:hypothetical protein